MRKASKKRAILALLSVLFATCALTVATAEFFFGSKDSTVTISQEEYDRLKRFERLDTMLMMVESMYYEEPDVDAMLEYAAIGLMFGLDDPYSYYYTPEDYAAMEESVDGTYAGIGTQLIVDPNDYLMTVTRVFKGSPAEEAGVLAGGFTPRLLVVLSALPELYLQKPPNRAGIMT